MYGRDISKKKSHTSDEIPEVGFSDCKKQAEHLKTVINHVWKRFSKSYFNELRQHQLYEMPKLDLRLNVGDVVLIKDDIPLPQLISKRKRKLLVILKNLCFPHKAIV